MEFFAKNSTAFLPRPRRPPLTHSLTTNLSVSFSPTNQNNQNKNK